MGIFETYSKRKKRLERVGQQDVYQYDDLPQPFRNWTRQAVLCWIGGDFVVATGIGTTNLSSMFFRRAELQVGRWRCPLTPGFRR